VFPESRGQPAVPVQRHIPHSRDALFTSWLTFRPESRGMARDNIEAATGINLAKNQLAYRTATVNAEGAVPEMLMQILSKADGK